MICLYHSRDLDGHCSGAIVKKAHPDCELIPIDYGDPVPWEKLSGIDTLVLVDFSLEPFSEMERLWAQCNKVIWIDHHVSAYRAYSEAAKHPGNVIYVYDEGRAACELAWEFFVRDPMPEGVRMLGAYDCWRYVKEPGAREVLAFQMGMRLEATDPREGFFNWEEVFVSRDGFLGNKISQGKIILRYQEQVNSVLMRNSFMTEFKGLRFLAVNGGPLNSNAFASAYDKDKHDALMAFWYTGDTWSVSLYSPDKSRDLSVIAKEMGGGGHAAACGFRVREIGEVVVGM